MQTITAHTRPPSVATLFDGTPAPYPSENNVRPSTARVEMSEDADPLLHLHSQLPLLSKIELLVSTDDHSSTSFSDVLGIATIGQYANEKTQRLQTLAKVALDFRRDVGDLISQLYLLLSASPDDSEMSLPYRTALRELAILTLHWSMTPITQVGEVFGEKDLRDMLGSQVRFATVGGKPHAFIELSQILEELQPLLTQEAAPNTVFAFIESSIASRDPAVHDGVLDFGITLTPSESIRCVSSREQFTSEEWKLALTGEMAKLSPFLKSGWSVNLTPANFDNITAYLLSLKSPSDSHNQFNVTVSNALFAKMEGIFQKIDRRAEIRFQESMRQKIERAIGDAVALIAMLMRELRRLVSATSEVLRMMTEKPR